MYFFVIFNAIVTMVIGVLLLVGGIGVAVAGFLQNAAIVELTNQYVLAGTNIRMLDARFYTSLLGLLFFLSGMVTAAVGQLFIVFADIATNMRELNRAYKNTLASRLPGEAPVVPPTPSPEPASITVVSPQQPVSEPSPSPITEPPTQVSISAPDWLTAPNPTPAPQQASPQSADTLINMPAITDDEIPPAA